MFFHTLLSLLLRKIRGSLSVHSGSDTVFFMGRKNDPPTHAQNYSCPAVWLTTPQKMTAHRGPNPHTPCCKLTLDKKLKLVPKAGFHDKAKVFCIQGGPRKPCGDLAHSVLQPHLLILRIAGGIFQNKVRKLLT